MAGLVWTAHRCDSAVRPWQRSGSGLANQLIILPHAPSILGLDLLGFFLCGVSSVWKREHSLQMFANSTSSNPCLIKNLLYIIF